MSLPDSSPLRQRSSASYINFSRPRSPLAENPFQASFEPIDPSLIPAPLQLRRPPSQTPLRQPQYLPLAPDLTTGPAQAQTQSGWQSTPPRPSFESRATIGTQASSFSAESVDSSNLSSNDHFNLSFDPEQHPDNQSHVTEPSSDSPNLDTVSYGSIGSDQFQLGGPYLCDLTGTQQLSGQDNGHMNTALPFQLPQPQPEFQPLPQRKPLPISKNASDAIGTKLDVWYPPKDPRRVRKVDFNQIVTIRYNQSSQYHSLASAYATPSNITAKVPSDLWSCSQPQQPQSPPLPTEQQPTALGRPLLNQTQHPAA